MKSGKTTLVVCKYSYVFCEKDNEGKTKGGVSPGLRGKQRERRGETGAAVL